MKFPHRTFVMVGREGFLVGSMRPREMGLDEIGSPPPSNLGGKLFSAAAQALLSASPVVERGG